MNEPANILALQTLVFEMNWPTYKWIEKIFIRDGSTIVFYTQYSKLSIPSKESLGACTKMFEEIFAAVYEKGTTLRVEYGSDSRNESGWSVLMSDDVFKRLAAEVAPWRLGAGR